MLFIFLLFWCHFAGRTGSFFLFLFYHESADSKLCPYQHSCLCSISWTCLPLLFSVCVCMPTYMHSVRVFLPTYTQLPCRRILSLNLIKTLTSRATGWVAYLCLWRSLSPLTSFCLVLVARLVTGHARNSMWPRLSHPCGQSSELSHSQNKLIQRVEREVRSVIIPGLWRGCCQAVCTGGGPSCYLRPTRMQADRRQVHPPGAGRGARMLIFCLCNRAGNIACCGAWETISWLSLWTVVGGNKMHLLGCPEDSSRSGLPSAAALGLLLLWVPYCALLDLHGLLHTCIFLSPFYMKLLLVVARCLLKLQGYRFSSLLLYTAYM